MCKIGAMYSKVLLSFDILCLLNTLYFCFFLCQLLDLCILAIDSLEFQYRVLAAAALCHFTSIEVVEKATGKPLFYPLSGSQLLEDY